MYGDPPEPEPDLNPAFDWDFTSSYVDSISGVDVSSNRSGNLASINAADGLYGWTV